METSCGKLRLIGEKKPHGGTAALLQLSRKKGKNLVTLLTGYAMVNYDKHKKGFVGWRRKQIDTSFVIARHAGTSEDKFSR